MSRIQVDPGALHGAAGRLVSTGSQLGGIRGELAAAAGAAGAMGEANAAGSYLGMCDAWATALALIETSIQGLGATTNGAAGAYVTTDNSAFGGGP